MCRHRYVYWTCGDPKCYAGRIGVCNEKSAYDPSVTDYSRKCARCEEADRAAAEARRPSDVAMRRSSGGWRIRNSGEE
ncbi:hypothetical protein IFR05_016794, partial [Cadophora sp. M221]